MLHLLVDSAKMARIAPVDIFFNINFIFTPFYFVPSQMIMRQVPGLGLLGAMCSDIDEFERD